MKHIYEKNNFIFLLFGLVFFLFLGAIVEQMQTDIGQVVVTSSTVVMLALGVLSFKETRHRFWGAIVVLAAMFAVVVISLILKTSGLRYTHLMLMLGFFIWTTWLAARQVLFTGSIDDNKIVGAICIYLLLGLIWTMMYLLIAEVVPDAFNGLQQAPWYDNFSELSYYSFATLTTLGYGDITPNLPVSQFLAYMEAVVGVLYIAILVASLIGVRMSTLNSNGE